MTPYLLLFIPLALALAWGVGRLPVRPVSEDEAEDHYAQMRARKERR